MLFKGDLGAGAPAARGDGDAPIVGPDGRVFDSRECESAFGASAAPRYRQWEFELVAPHLGRSTLEVGVGMGHFAERLASAGLDRLVLGDADSHCLTRLREQYADRPDVEVVEVCLPGPVPIQERVESAVAMNVLEHIEDDAQALRSVASAVLPGGRIVIWVPGYMRLYGEFDRKIGHYRRYTPATIRAAVESAGLAVRFARPVNLLGGIAWWVAVRRGGVGTPDPRLVALYDNVVVPASRAIEKVLRPPFGQSILCVADVG
jgi:SAM-dependent methyltransferase